MQPHPILQQSFQIIDHEMGEHRFTAEEYAVIRRVIHSTADFEFQHLIHFSPGVIEHATTALSQGIPIITDVTMVRQGIINLVQQTFNNPVVCAVTQAQSATAEQTRTEIGLHRCLAQYPKAIYVIGNAPTALLALCHHFQTENSNNLSAADSAPVDNATLTCVIGAPVGFVSVLESKTALAQTAVPQIRVEGRKGGSAVAAAIVNALLTLAWQQQSALEPG